VLVGRNANGTQHPTQKKTREKNREEATARRLSARFLPPRPAGGHRAASHHAHTAAPAPLPSQDMSRASPTTPDPWAAVTISPTWLGCSGTNPQAHTHTRIRSIYLHPSAGVLATIIGRQSAPHTPCPVPTVFEASLLLLLLLPTGYPSLLPSPVATPSPRDAQPAANLLTSPDAAAQRRAHSDSRAKPYSAGPAR
jgi:hypothetical protein